MPINAPLELRFDRFLFPLGLEAGLRLYSGDPQQDAKVLRKVYDPVERVLTFEHDDLVPGALYTAEVVPSSIFGIGLWAFDGAPLEPGPVPLTFRFMTAATAAPLPPAPAVVDCAAVVSQVFTRQKTDPNTGFGVRNCADLTCHGKLDDNHPGVMGLRLDDRFGVATTAVGHIAHEADTGEVAGSPLKTPLRFGTGMAIVDLTSPETSYLLYKLLRKPENYDIAPGVDGCLASVHQAPLPAGTCTYPSPAELEALREWFSRGLPMPRDDQRSPFSHRSLDRHELNEVADWIAQGLSCDPP